MSERIVFMQVEDMMATFEREDGSTISYPVPMVPQPYKEGDVIKAIIHFDWIEFVELDIEEMERRRAQVARQKLVLRQRARRSTNKA